MKRKILLLRIGDIDQVVLEKLRQNLEKSFSRFNIEVEILPNQFPLTKSEYNTKRNQYDAQRIKNRLKKNLANQNYNNILGIIDKDLFFGPTNFVFGLADIAHRKKPPLFALISILRLKEEFYQKEKNPLLYELRVLKEAKHELGHTFGLGHCSQVCVMQFSNHIWETDTKPDTYCTYCLEKLYGFFE